MIIYSIPEAVKVGWYIIYIVIDVEWSIIWGHEVEQLMFQKDLLYFQYKHRLE